MDDHWDAYQRSKRAAMKALGLGATYVGDRGVEMTYAAADERVDDWGPGERPSPEDYEAARELLGENPRPPARVMADDNGSQWAVRWYDEAGTTTAKQMFDSIARMKKVMEANGAPKPAYVLVHPDIAKDL